MRRHEIARLLGDAAYKDDIVYAYLASATEETSEKDLLLSIVRHLVQEKKRLVAQCVHLTRTQTPIIHITCQRCGFTPEIVE